MNEKILKIPYSAVREDWDLLQKFLVIKGNPKYILVGNINLHDREDIFDLGNLVGIDGNLFFRYSPIESLGELEFVNGYLILYGCKNIKTLGNLKKVVGGLNLTNSSIESLGELEFVGKDLWIDGTNIPPSEIKKVNVVGEIFR
jgi:hypothetical protein